MAAYDAYESGWSEQGELSGGITGDEDAAAEETEHGGGRRYAGSTSSNLTTATSGRRLADALVQAVPGFLAGKRVASVASIVNAVTARSRGLHPEISKCRIRTQE